MTSNHWTRGASSALASRAAILVPTMLMAAIALGTVTASAAARRAKNSYKPGAAAASKTAAKSKARSKKVGEFNPADDTVELFDAIEAGDINVKLIPKDSAEGRVFIVNKTKKPLNVKLPPAFAAVPVLAQMGGMGGGGGQGLGGGGGGGGMMGGGGGGFFNVPAEKEGNFKVACMCLEHGKPEPRPAMTYKIIPIGEFTQKPGVKELCTMLGSGTISQRAAQVAAWHLNNDMSWDELASKVIEHVNGIPEPYFTAEELHAGMNLVASAMSQVDDRPEVKKTPSPGETAGGESSGG